MRREITSVIGEFGKDWLITQTFEKINIPKQFCRKDAGGRNQLGPAFTNMDMLELNITLQYNQTIQATLLYYILQ